MDQDLRTLLTLVRDDAPPPRLSVDDITAAGRHLARRRRRLALLSSVGGGAVTTIVAVTAALVFAASPTTPLTPAVDPSTLPSPAGPAAVAWADAQMFMTTYRGYEAGGYLVRDPDLVTGAYQQSSIDATPDLSQSTPSPRTSAALEAKARAALARRGALVVYRQGAFDPSEFVKGGTKVSGRSGVSLLLYAGAGGPTLSATERARMQKMQPQVPTLAWQYAPDAWAVIYWSTWETVPDRDELMRIADGLTPAEAKQFPIGFAAGILPKGYQLLSVSFGGDMDREEVFSAARLTPKVPALPLSGPYEFESIPALTLSAGRTGPNPKLVGRVDCTDSTSCTQIVGDGSTYVQAEVNGLKPTTTTVAQITRTMKPLDPSDTTGWPAVTDAFPPA